MNKVVYLHQRLDTNKIFYVGIGSEERAYNKTQRSLFWKKIVKKAGLKVCIVRKGLSREEAVMLEKELIGFYGRMDLDNGILCNMTNGGDGCLKRVVSKENRKKAADTFSRVWKGVPKSPEHIEKVAAKNRGRKHSSETIKKLSDSHKDEKSVLFGKYGSAHPTSKAIICITTNVEYEGISDAARKLGLNVAHIGSVLKGRIKATGHKKYPGGLHFIYKHD